jgi:hypothetical protein
MSDEEQTVTDAQAGLVNLPPVDTADWTGWLKDVIQAEQLSEQNSYMTPQEEQAGIDAGQYARAFAAAVAAATGSGSPSAPAAAAPAPADTQVTDQGRGKVLIHEVSSSAIGRWVRAA